MLVVNQLFKWAEAASELRCSELTGTSEVLHGLNPCLKHLLKFEDCGEHCRSWEFPHSGLDSGFRFVLGFFTCLQGAVVHWPNRNLFVLSIWGYYTRKIQHHPLNQTLNHT